MSTPFPIPAAADIVDAETLAAALAPRIAAELVARLRIDILAGDDLILSADEASRVLGRSPKTLELWRSTGSGPRWIRLGLRAIAYRLGDVKSYSQSRPAFGRRVVEAALPSVTE